MFYQSFIIWVTEHINTIRRSEGKRSITSTEAKDLYKELFKKLMEKE